MGSEIDKKLFEDTGIKVKYIPVTTDEVTKRVLTQPNSFDIVDTEYFSLPKLVPSGNILGMDSKRIKEFDNIEAICGAKEKEVPERLDEIREIFMNHPVVTVDDSDLIQGDVDVGGLKKFLVEDRQFSQKRFDNAMDLLEDAGLVRTGGQTSLFSF